MSTQKNQSIGDGILVLEALAASSVPIGSRAISRLLGMEPTRANRILRTLCDIGIASQDASRKYLPGPAIHVLSSLALNSSSLLKVALPIMEEHRNKRYTMALGMLWRDKVTYLVHAEPRVPLIEGISRVGLFPASQSSIGLALMNPQAKCGYAKIKIGDHYSVGVAISGDPPLAALAYSDVPGNNVSSAATALKKMASLIGVALR